MHDHDIDPHFLQQRDILGEGIDEFFVDHRRAAVLNDKCLPAVAADVRERLYKDFGLRGNRDHGLRA